MNFISKIRFLAIFKSLICSCLNLLMYAIIAISILGLTQGYVIPIDLFLQDSKLELIVNLTMFHFLLYFMALIMSLYPTYVYSFLFEENNTKKYTSAKLGLIYYKLPNFKDCPEPDEPLSISKKPNNHQELKFVEGVVRKFLAVLLFNVWSILIVRVFCEHQIDCTQIYVLYIFCAFFTISTLYLFYYFAYLKKKEIRASENKANAIRSILKLLKYNRYFLAFLFVLLLGSAAYFGWHILTIIIDIIFCFSLSLEIILFRSYRKYIKPFCKITELLKYYRILGIVTLLFIIGLNSSTAFAEFNNPLNIILSYLIALYTVIVLFFKTYLYLRFKNPKGEQNHIPLGFKFTIKHFTYLSIIAIIYLGISFKKSSKIHHLETIPATEGIGINDFYSKYKSQKNPNKKTLLYAAYGGGLKANYWNLLILDSLKQAQKFKDIAAFSGVSGGGMGIGTYTALEYTNQSSEEKKLFFNKIRRYNILSIELSWLFGLDFIREYLFPFVSSGKGRAKRSATFYAKNFNLPSLSTDLSLYDVHKRLYNQSYYPNIIINSTSTKDLYGVASAVKKSQFPGAINVLDLKDNQTISYLDAVSTCNRFPLISPAAYVPGKGQFIDGGYFENSGILSLYSFYNHLKSSNPEDSLLQDGVKIISVRNSKMSYLKSLVTRVEMTYNQLSNDSLSCIKGKKDLATIIEGAINLERLPNVTRSIMENNPDSRISFLDIDLPYYISKKEIEEELGGTLTASAFSKIYSIVNKSNEEIKSILSDPSNDYNLKQWGVVNPPTARILSKPVELYMELMMQHPNVKKQLESIIKD